MYLSSIFFRCSLFPVCDWRQTVRIYCRDTFRVVISKRVSPDDRLDFLKGQFCRIKLIELFLFQRRKPAFHPGIIPAFANSAHTLDSVQLSERLFVFATRILASTVAMNDHSAFYIKVFVYLRYCFYTQFLFHIRIHCKRNDLSIITVQKRRHIQFSVLAQYLRVISVSSFLKGACALKSCLMIFCGLIAFLSALIPFVTTQASGY